MGTLKSAGEPDNPENPNPVYWGDKRYHSLDYHLRTVFGEKLYKISLNGNMSCPNRDGTLGNRGCIFCSQGGSGDFAADPRLSITKQIETGKKQAAGKFKGSGYIAYFQAYTNTYAPLSYLRQIFTEAIRHPDIRALSIATRPDCLEPPVLSLLEELSQIKPVWVELGLQTIHERTAAFIRRGYPLSVFEKAIADLRALDISVIVHTILFLPGESREDMYETISYLNEMDIQGIKLQLLHVLEGTDLAEYYRQHPFHIPDMEEYFQVAGQCISLLRPDIVIHRLTGDGPKSLLVAPLWTGNKRLVLNQMQAYLKRQDIWQGRSYHTWQSHLHCTN